MNKKMSNNQIFIEDEIEVEDCVFNSKSDFPIHNFKKDNIKNWSFKSKNTSNYYNIRSSDVNKILDSNYSVHFTDSTEQKDFTPSKQMMNFANYIKRENESCSVEVFSYCDGSRSNSNRINIPQNFEYNHNYMNGKVLREHKIETAVIDLTDSLSEIPEEISKIDSSKFGKNPCDKMAKYLENNGTEKMTFFSEKKKEYEVDYFTNKKGSGEIIIEDKLITNNSDYMTNNKLNNINNNTNNNNLKNFPSKNQFSDNAYQETNFITINLKNCENIHENSENNKISSLKFNNLDTQSYRNYHKKNSDYEYENENLDKDDFYNIINTEENCDNIIEDETLLNQKSSKDFTDNKNADDGMSLKKLESQEEGIKILKSSHNVFIEGSKSDLKVEDYVYDESIKIIKYLSEGAQAKIYIGHIEEINKYVAIKRYYIIENDDNLINKINAECEFIKSLDHANIIKYYDIDINYKNNFTTIDLIMEYVEGYNLKEFVKSEDYIYLEREEKDRIIKFIVKNILMGISYLHSNKIIHRDLKPENVVISLGVDDVKIVDFGISTKVKDSETFKARSVLGTPWYMAPEVIMEKPYAFEADIWSVGCILYELVSGLRPYNDTNPFNAMIKMAEFSSPLEYADDEIKDIFYARENRNLLDFLQKCWRVNNMFRPSANEFF